MNASNVLTKKEIDAYDAMKVHLSGLTLQEGYNAISALKGLLEIMGREVDDCNEFILD
jgi:hypothetical protein